MQNGGRSVIKAEVKPAGSMYLTETLAIDCSGDELGSFARNFVFLLPASIPTEYLISLEFRAVTGELLDDIQLQVLTHYQQTSLFDFCDGHSLSSVELPCPKKELVGEFLLSCACQNKLGLQAYTICICLLGLLFT